MPEITEEVQKQLKEWQLSGIQVGARTAALTVLEKIQPYHKADITKEELVNILDDLEEFCKKFYNIELPKGSDVNG